MSDAELADRIEGISVFARVHPAQKLRIVDAYQRRGEVVAMTGDGVNDAPALVKADVGVAMGITGTEVAKEAAKIVIGDDNFATIVAAVEEGRVVYRNIKKVVLYLFSTSIAEVLVLVLALILGYPPPLAAVQILWINLVTEGTVTVNLIMEPAEGDEMKLRPIPPDEPLLTRVLLSRMAFMTPAIAVSTLGWFVYRISVGLPFPQVQTETFTVLAVCQWFNVLNCRSERRSALRPEHPQEPLAHRRARRQQPPPGRRRLPSAARRRVPHRPVRPARRSSPSARSPAWSCGSRSCASSSCADAVTPWIDDSIRQCRPEDFRWNTSHSLSSCARRSTCSPPPLRCSPSATAHGSPP